MTEIDSETVYETDIQSFHAGSPELERKLLQTGAIRADRKIVQAGKLSNTLVKMVNSGSYQRFTAGEANLGNAKANKYSAYPDDFIEAQPTLMAFVIVELRRHAIGTPQIATIGHG